MIKRPITPVNHPKVDRIQQQPRRIFGRDLKNVIVNYHSKFQEQNKTSKKNLIGQSCQLKKNKVTLRNNSQKNFNQFHYQDLQQQTKQHKRSIAQSTQASPKSITIKDYLKSKAPKATSQISTDLEINYEMRQLVVIWLIEIVNKIPLKNQVLFHSVFIFDRMLSTYKSSPNGNFVICIENLQLLALSCLFISAKYEQIYPPLIDYMVKIADYTYSKKKIVQMEAQILKDLEFVLTFPTRLTFYQQILNQQTQIQTQRSKRHSHLSLFLLELSLVQLWDETNEEQIALACIFLSKKVLGIIAQSPPLRISQVAWKLMQTWKEKRNSPISYIFDSEKFSFVGGIYLDEK